MGDETRAHYDHLAPVYDQNWAYSLDFLEWMQPVGACGWACDYEWRG